MRRGRFTTDNTVSSAHPLKSLKEVNFVVAALTSGEAKNHFEGFSR